MRMRALLAVVVALSSLSLGGCDSSGGDGPPPPSVFPQEDPFARQIAGRVVRGTEVVAGAQLQLDASEGLANDARLKSTNDPGRVTGTDPGGKYFVVSGPLVYDLAIRKDREVVVFRGLGVRYYEPSFGPDAGVRGFTARLAAGLEPPPAPGNAVAFFVSGPEARAVSGDPSSLLVTFRSFESVLTLHAVEYVASRGLVSAVRAGQVELRVREGGAAAELVRTIPIETASDVTFVAAAPAGFAVPQLEVVMDFGLRTSEQRVASVVPGVPLHIDVVLGARYAVRARASRGDGALSDSGRQLFDPLAPSVELELPPALPTEVPFEGAALTAELTEGVVEHLLTPASPDGTTMRVLTTTREAPVPDVTRFGLPRATGRYTWTIQHYPEPAYLDRFSGEDARVILPSSTSQPRVIELR